MQKDIRIQHLSFAFGHPEYYWTSLKSFNCADRTGSGALDLVWSYPKAAYQHYQPKKVWGLYLPSNTSYTHHHLQTEANTSLEYILRGNKGSNKFTQYRHSQNPQVQPDTWSGSLMRLKLQYTVFSMNWYVQMRWSGPSYKFEGQNPSTEKNTVARDKKAVLSRKDTNKESKRAPIQLYQRLGVESKGGWGCEQEEGAGRTDNGADRR